MSRTSPSRGRKVHLRLPSILRWAKISTPCGIDTGRRWMSKDITSVTDPESPLITCKTCLRLRPVAA